ncbi:MAG: CDP-alcohol phosphatidyltransferase family protein, partial [Rhodospirillales bacterium]
GLLFTSLGNELKMQPLWISKFNTAMQIIYAVFVLSVLGLGLPEFGLTGFFCYAVAATTILSGLAYLVIWSRKAVHWEGESL